MEFEADKNAKIKKDMEDSGLLQASQARQYRVEKESLNKRIETLDEMLAIAQDKAAREIKAKLHAEEEITHLQDIVGDLEQNIANLN